MLSEAESRYENAKSNERLARQRLFIADGEGKPESELCRLQAELDAASSERKEAFKALYVGWTTVEA